MKHLKSIQEYVDTSSMESRAKELSEEEFLEILDKNCKNFSFSNDQLYRGSASGSTYSLFIPQERATKGITYVDFFKKKKEDTEKYPVIRSQSLIGIGGGNDIKDMFKVAKAFGEGDVKLVIPYDNSKIVFTAFLDLFALQTRLNVGNKDIKDEDFIMVEYKKGFKAPTDYSTKILKKYGGFNFVERHERMGFEFFTSSNCLLLNIQDNDRLNWLKKIRT